MKKEILNLINEDIQILIETLGHLRRMNIKGIDPINSKYLRNSKSEFINRTLSDIQWMMDFREKFKANT